MYQHSSHTISATNANTHFHSLKNRVTHAGPPNFHFCAEAITESRSCFEEGEKRKKNRAFKELFD